jgi:hypothetical protein
MADKQSTSRKADNQLTALRLSAEFSDLFHSLASALFNPYRPELHYMRGPGPKWHAKHAPVLVAVDACRRR